MEKEKKVKSKYEDNDDYKFEYPYWINYGNYSRLSRRTMEEFIGDETYNTPRHKRELKILKQFGY